MIVDFTIQHGSEINTHRGLCIAVNPSEITILTKKKKFQTYPGDGQQIKEIIPTHTKMSYSFEQGQFHNISIDSMHSLFRSGKFTKIDIQGSDQYIYVEQGIEKKVSTLSMEWPNTLILREIPNTKTITRSVNPSIQLKLQDLKMYRTIDKKELTEYTTALKAYQEKQQAISTETEEVKKELLMIEFTKMKLPTRPSGQQDKIDRLRMEIKALRDGDEMKYLEEVKDAEVEPLELSGSYERILINGKMFN